MAATGRVNVRGTAAGRRIQTRVAFAIQMSGATRLESVESFERKFVFSAVGDDATLLLPARNLVVPHESTSAILEATLGLPLTTTDVQRLFVCPRGGSGSFSGTEKLADDWLRLFGSGPDGPIEVYFRQDGSRGVYKLVAMIHRTTTTGAAWRADFHDQRNGIWRRVHLMSVDWKGETSLSYDVELTVEDIQVNPVIERAALSVSVPASARPIALDEFRATPRVRR
jgi:hypothetical protein